MGSEDEMEVVEKYGMEGMICLELVLRYKQTSRQLPGTGSSASRNSH
jgi:hypothetical protein